MSVLAPTLTAAESVIEAALDEETLVLNVESGLYFGLDGVGARIWQLLSDATTEEEIIEQLLLEYDVERAQLRHDVTAFIEVLAANGLTRVLIE